MWVDYVDSAFKERAPKIITDPDGKKGDFFVIPGQEPEKVGGGFSAGATPEEMKAFLEEASVDEQCPLGAYIPEERVKELKIDGVEAELLYTTLGFRLFRLTDAPYQQALFRAFNTWLSEYCSYDPKHMIGLGLISLLQVEEGVKELHRCSTLGLRGALIMASAFTSLPDMARKAEMRVSLKTTTILGLLASYMKCNGPLRRSCFLAPWRGIRVLR